MKFYCDRDLLNEAVANASKATNTASPLPIMTGIKVEAGSTLVLKATNGEISVECEIAANITEPGETVLDSRMLFDIVRKAPAGVLNVDTDDKNGTVIYTKNNKYNIQGMDAAEFPNIGIFGGGRLLEMPSSAFKEIVRDTIFATAADESRPILTGVKFEVCGDEMKLIAIDGFRLAIRKQIIKGCGENFEFIVKNRILNEVMKILREDSTPVKIFVGDNSIMFECENCKITSSLLGGEYISYAHFIPQSSPIEVTVDRRLLTQTVERAAIIINYDDNRIPVILNIDEQFMKVEGYSKMGNFNEEMDIKSTGGALEIGLGIKFLTEALKAVDEDEITIGFNDEKSPCVIVAPDGETYIYLILPRQIKK